MHAVTQFYSVVSGELLSPPGVVAWISSRSGGGVTTSGFLTPLVGSLHEHSVVAPKIKKNARGNRFIGLTTCFTVLNVYVMGNFANDGIEPSLLQTFRMIFYLFRQFGGATEFPSALED